MTIQEHLEKRLKSPTEYSLSEEERKTIQFEGIETFIYRKLTSGKFRKTSIDADSQKRVKEAIALNVKANEPIKFTYPFGGYKIWRVPTYPTVDWAEFMTISYVLRYIAPVAKAYEHGVEVYFSSDDVVIKLIDNYPREDLDSYAKSFRELLTHFEKHLPGNVKMDLKQVVPDYYTKEEYDTELEELFEQFKKKGLSEERKTKLKNVSFAFNFMRDGKEDLTKDSDYEAILEDLMLYSDAYLKLEKRRAFIRGDDKIVLFSNKISNAIDIGSTNVSKAKFWAGIGILEADERLHDRILSPKQWKAVKDSLTNEASDLIPMKNFDSISVSKERLNFLGN